MKKITKKKMEQLKEEHRLHNKEMRQKGRKSECLTLDEFIATRYGLGKKPTGVVSVKEPKAIRRDTKEYKSLKVSGDLSAACAKRDSNTYSGTLVKGIATMHKSNAVPVLDEEYAKEISRMRRG